MILDGVMPFFLSACIIYAIIQQMAHFVPDVAPSIIHSIISSGLLSLRINVSNA